MQENLVIYISPGNMRRRLFLTPRSRIRLNHIAWVSHWRSNISISQNTLAGQTCVKRNAISRWPRSVCQKWLSRWKLLLYVRIYKRQRKSHNQLILLLLLVFDASIIHRCTFCWSKYKEHGMRWLCYCYAMDYGPIGAAEYIYGNILTWHFEQSGRWWHDAVHARPIARLLSKQTRHTLKSYSNNLGSLCPWQVHGILWRRIELPVSVVWVIGSNILKAFSYKYFSTVTAYLTLKYAFLLKYFFINPKIYLEIYLECKIFHIFRHFPWDINNCKNIATPYNPRNACPLANHSRSHQSTQVSLYVKHKVHTILYNFFKATLKRRKKSW